LIALCGQAERAALLLSEEALSAANGNDMPGMCEVVQTCIGWMVQLARRVKQESSK